MADIKPLKEVRCSKCGALLTTAEVAPSEAICAACFSEGK